MSYVGIHPEGARELVAAMESARNAISDGFLADLRHALCVAQSDAVLEAQASFTVYQRYRAFLEESARELRWRVKVITSAPDATVDGETVYGTTQFESAKKAAEQGAADGAQFKELWAKAERDGDWRAVEEWLAAHRDQLKDPEYAAAFLRSFGKENVVALLNKATEAYGPGSHLGLSPEQLAYFQERFQPLMDAVAAADDPELRAHLLDRLGLDAMAVLLVSTRMPEDFVRAAIPILTRTFGLAVGVTDYNASLTMTALGSYPELLQELLADPATADLLLGPRMLADPGYRKALAASLPGALDQATSDPATLDQAWSNVLRLASQDYFVDAMAGDEALSLALTTAFLPYLENAGHLMAASYIDGMPGLDLPPAREPLLPAGVTPEMVQDFLGGAIVHQSSSEALARQVAELMAGSGLEALIAGHGGDYEKMAADPALNDEMVAALGPLGIVLGALYSAQGDNLRRADSSKQERELYLGFFTGLGTAKISDAALSSLAGVAAQLGANSFAQWLAGRPDDITPEQYAEGLRDSYVTAFTDLLVDHEMDRKLAEEVAVRFGLFFDAMEGEALKQQNSFN
ncbi:hypothetical protein ACIBH1_03560 [Nonomuraea sp. NPDC050663]|uniref:hypothetical protein n=1 Tax=Nonomuraea sp. NPDC050663 TaxID=3364370 RepID=UPI00379C4F92